jgi:hypothetical protein
MVESRGPRALQEADQVADLRGVVTMKNAVEIRGRQTDELHKIVDLDCLFACGREKRRKEGESEKGRGKM